MQDITSVIPNYNAFLVDIWGTVHMGGVLYSNTKVTLENMMARGYVILLSNAPRPAEKVAKFLLSIGIEKGKHYHEVLTSGQAFIYYAAERKYKTVMYIGPDKDLDILSGTDINITRNVNSEFDDAILTGLTNIHNINEDIPVLNELLKHQRRLLCVNPDIVVNTANGLEYCAGELARIYQDMGGKVVYFGKPYAEIYEIAKGMIGHKVANPKILAIGDTMETDVLGASRAGIDTVLCINGVAEQNIKKHGLEKFLGDFPYRPSFIIKEL